MKMRKALAVFLASICIFTSIGICTVSASDGADTVYATTSTSVDQDSYGYLFVYLDDLTDLASLSVSVYYDAEKITVLEEYNVVSCQLCDSVLNDGCVQFSYIFDGEEGNTNNLFYFRYKVKDNATLGDAYFDIIVNDAYSTSLKSLPISGSRCAFEITKKATAAPCYVYSNNTVFTSVEDQFELSYELSTYELASGSFTVTYDPEFFEVASYTLGGVLENKITDVNASCPGTLYVSFVGTEYAAAYDLIRVTFKTVKNAGETSEIKLNVTEFHNLDLNQVFCSGYSTAATVFYDNSYTKDSPAMSIHATYSPDTGKVTATITLEANSMLGAGDFELRFDPSILTYHSYSKEFSPTFFLVNDTDAQNGSFKFMIVSTSDITEEKTVITVVFDAEQREETQISPLLLLGSDLTDSMTNEITLHFESTAVTIPRPRIKGDLNGDGRLTAVDCAVLNAYVSGKLTLSNEDLVVCDVDGNGDINKNDVLALVNNILGK